jgi:NADH-quinone oxidoreductase subunit A
MFVNYIPLLFIVFLNVSLAGIIVFLSYYLGPRRPTVIKSESFECGNPPLPSSAQRLDVKFYLVAILFLIFDVEMVFLYPFLVVLHHKIIQQSTAEVLQLSQMLIAFGVTLSIGLIYAWRNHALDWNTTKSYNP